jgi:alpha,alpha-trehalose phosphorylase
MHRISSDPLPRDRFPLHEWALVETSFNAQGQGHAESIFALGNGYLGLRGNMDEGRDGHVYGTYINGFHETWPIRHAEEAHGFARVGQTIVNVPDAKVIRLYVDDEPFVLSEADIRRYTRTLSFIDGVLSRDIEWQTPSGKVVVIRSRRGVSFTERHLAFIEFEVTVLNSSASIVLSSQIINRQDDADAHHGGSKVAGADFDPRQGETLAGRVLQPEVSRAADGRYLLGYRTTNSGMTLVVGADHRLTTDGSWTESSFIDDDRAKHVYTVATEAGQTVTLVKTFSYHTSRGVPTHELADRCDRTLDRARTASVSDLVEDQTAWLSDFWRRSDVTVGGRPELQQAIRWNLFQLAQSTARIDGQGIAAKGVSGAGYGGHYFWDGEIFVLPFLTYTSPSIAHNALRFRLAMLDAAKARAAEMSQRGALFPWRTINGLESSAYYAASTAQYHIDADIVYALMKYVEATGDEAFLERGAVDILVETARMWEDLGFWRVGDERRFHIDGVTGPDEYTTVVNDNLYTNVMARANLRAAVRVCRRLQSDCPEVYAAMVQRLDLESGEVDSWSDAAESMEVPYDAHRGIHPQDSHFLDRELWDLESTPDSMRPLLLHYHPLVIYRFQVLKQADVVLALFLQGNEFTADEKRRDFDYYDALTTGDSSLSAAMQAVIAAEVGYDTLAEEYFLSAAFVDLADSHGNTSDGLHVAGIGGVWSSLVYGFGGLRDYGGTISFDPRLPKTWQSLAFRLTVRGVDVVVDLTADSIAFEVLGEGAVDVTVRGERVVVEAGVPVTVALTVQRMSIVGAPPTTDDLQELTRADGSLMTASIPTVASLSAELETGSVTEQN